VNTNCLTKPLHTVD